MQRKWDRGLADERGGVAVEFGLMLPILVLLISGLFYFGLAYNVQLSLTHAAREGVRVYALIPDGDWQQAVEDAAFTLDGVTATSSGDCDPASPSGDMAWVRAQSDVELSLAFMPAQSITLTGQAVMRCGG